MSQAQSGEEPEDVIVRLAGNLVNQALSQGWNGPPFNPEILASLQGIKVEDADSTIDADARLLPLPDGRLGIQYDSSKPRTRVNFSICHELAHTFFPDAYETTRYRRQKSSADHEYMQLEWLCDLAAAELLMPRASFTTHLAENDVSLQTVRRLSALYEASGEAVLIRISQLSQRPCAIVFLSEKFKPAEKKAMQTPEFDLGFRPSPPKLRVDYVRASAGFPIFIPQDKSVPNDSVAYSALRTPDAVAATEQWAISGFGQWQVQAIRIPQYPTAPSSRVAALILPTVDT